MQRRIPFFSFFLGALAIILLPLEGALAKPFKIQVPVEDAIESSLTPALPASPALGLTVKNGLFYKDDKPFSGVGINYFSCFIRITGIATAGPQLDNRDYRDGFRVLRSYDIPFVRFCAGGFYPSDWKLYQTDKKKYFELLDGLVAEAEKQKMGLIPSLFWFYPTIPDLVGESLDQWGNPQSKTHAFMRQYTTEVVSRYKDSPAIWGWEFGNEYLLPADLPQPEMGRGWIVPEFGGPTERTERDKMYRRNVYVAYKAFGEVVRSLDKTRPIFTGDAMPRPAAFHNWTEASWTMDSPEQWKTVYRADNPFDTHTVHFYYYEPEERPREAGVNDYDTDRQMAFLMEISREAGKPLFVGEFGESKVLPADVARAHVEHLLGLILENKVPLSALWNYDFEHRDQTHCNITTTNRRAWSLDALREANRKIRSRMEGGGARE